MKTTFFFACLFVLMGLMGPASAADDPTKKAVREYIENKAQAIANSPRLTIWMDPASSYTENSDMPLTLAVTNTLPAAIARVQFEISLPSGFTLKQASMPVKQVTPQKIAVLLTNIPAGAKQNYTLTLHTPLLPTRAEAKYEMTTAFTQLDGVTENQLAYLSATRFRLEPAAAEIALQQTVQNKPYSLNEAGEVMIIVSNKGPGVASQIAVETSIGPASFELLGAQVASGGAGWTADHKRIAIQFGDIPAGSTGQAKITFKPTGAGKAMIRSSFVIPFKSPVVETPNLTSEAVVTIMIQPKGMNGAVAPINSASPLTLSGDVYMMMNDKRWSECRAKFSDPAAQKNCAKAMAAEQMRGCEGMDKPAQTACLTRKFK